MIQLIKRLFAKPEKPAPMFQENDKIRFVSDRPATGARVAWIEGISNVGIGDYVSITADSWLFYDSETEDKVFFTVSTNWMPREGSLDAPPGCLVWFEKKHLQKMKYLLYK